MSNTNETSSTRTNTIQSSELPAEATAFANTVNRNDKIQEKREKEAKQSFRQASTEARHVLHNTALTLEKRILAGSVLFASGVLGHLDDRAFAARDCLQDLHELHSVPAVQKMFSVHIKGGIKSWFKKDSRARIVKSIVDINSTLANYIPTITEERIALFDWPLIKCDELAINPILHQEASVQNLKVLRETPLWDMKVLEEASISNPSQKCSFDSKGDLVCFFSGNDGTHAPGKFNRTTGELKLFSPLSEPIKTADIEYCCIAVDKDDTVYVLWWYNVDDGYVLSVYTEDGVTKYRCALELLKVRKCCYIAVTNDKRIVICCHIDHENITVYLCEITEGEGPQMQPLITGLRNHSVEGVFASSGEIIVATIDATKNSHVLYVYTEDGQLKRNFKFRPSEGGNNYISVCYNQATKTIIGFNVANSNIFVEYLSGQTGKLQCKHSLSTTNFPGNICYFHLICHSNDTLALTDGNHILLLHEKELVM